jgi:hypothetical protein
VPTLACVTRHLYLQLADDTFAGLQTKMIKALGAAFLVFIALQAGAPAELN